MTWNKTYITDKICLGGQATDELAITGFHLFTAKLAVQ
jgi:hypothetical protein